MKLQSHIRGGARRKGTVVVVVAISLTALLAFVALSIDGGLLVDKRRQVQSASDAAALAAAVAWGARLALGSGRPLVGGLLVLGLYGAAYLAITLAAGVGEARALAGRLRRRRARGKPGPDA